ncbi:MAG TPA: hypothetical protein VK992_01125 [Candidatus Caenarcaniphilales bacterium]|nr:hypothetical protein [Candidatus Caenarcaniphilales bacterium]
MAQTTEEARQEVVHARTALAAEVDDLGSATRAAVDIPAKVRRNPLRSAGLAGGAVFLGVGGPKRVLKAVERRVAPTRRQRLESVLPKDVARLVDDLGSNAEAVRDQLERDFRRYLERKHPEDTPNARRSFWRTYDILVGSLGTFASRALAKRLFETPPDRARGWTTGEVVSEEERAHLG